MLPDVERWLGRWVELAARDRGQELPATEARTVVDALAGHLAGGPPEDLERAGRLWGQAHRSVGEMVGSLSALREALVAGEVSDPLPVHRALDRLTAAATEEVLRRLEHASRTDALTGVGNRRAFDEALQAALSASARQGHDVTVVVVDLDGLKRINDTHGHAAGDAALVALVQAFQAALRDEDLVFRVGGDEFVLLLPFTSPEDAGALMERVQASGAPAFTWGAAGCPADGVEAGSLVHAADEDLYRRRLRRRPQRRLARRPARPATSPQPPVEARSPVLRWAWLPAAAVLVASLVATMVSATSPGPHLSAAPLPGRQGHHGTTTRPPGAGPPAPAGPHGPAGSEGVPGTPPAGGSTSAGGAASPGAGGARTAGGVPGGGAGAGVGTGGGGAGGTSRASPGPGGTGNGSGGAGGGPAGSGPGGGGGSGGGGSGGGSGPIGSLVAAVGGILAPVPVANSLVTSAPNGGTQVLGVVTLSGSRTTTAAAGTASAERGSGAVGQLVARLLA